MDGTRRLMIGECDGLLIDVAAQDATSATVDLSAALMFEREMPGHALRGGLLHLDQKLGGLLLQLRAEGVFNARIAETVLLAPSAGQIAGQRLLLVGMGEPESFDAARLERAARVAAREACRLGATSAALAPGLLDSGLVGAAVIGVGEAMLRGVVGGFRAELRLAELSLAPVPRLRRWSFDSGPDRLDAAFEAFGEAFRTLPPMQ